MVLDHDLDVVEGDDENVCRPRLLIIRGDDDEPCFPGLERRAVVTLDQAKDCTSSRSNGATSAAWKPDGALLRRVSSRDSTCFHG